MSRFLTPELARKAQAIIDRHMEAAIGILYGEDVGSADGWQLALDMGMAGKDDDPVELNQHMFQFGVFMEHVRGAHEQPTRYGTTPEEFIQAIEQDAVPRVSVEREASKHARHRAAERCRGLGNKIGATIGSHLIEADANLARKMRGHINDATAARYGDEAAIARMRRRGAEQLKPEGFYDDAFRQGIKRLVSDMGHLTDDWSRDWTRIAQTEAVRSQQEGQVAAWDDQELAQAEAEERPPERSLAYKFPRPDACPHCLRLHLEGGVPRIFWLDELVGNGDNVGRRAAAWKPIVGPTHPYCACSLHRLPRFIAMPKGWRSGSAAPSVVGGDGMLVLGDD